MYDYQNKNIENIIEGFKHKRCVIDGSSAGSGKTDMSLEACSRMKMRAFVLSGKHMLDFWMKKLNKYEIQYDLVNYECFKSGRYFQNDGRKTISFEKIKFEKFKANTLVIFDEIHKCRYETKMQKMLHKIVDTDVKILGLSGTINKEDCDYLPDFAFVQTHFESPFENKIIWTNKYTNASKVSFTFPDQSRLEFKKIPLYIKYFKQNIDKRVVMFCFFNETIRRLSIELKEYNPLIVNGLKSDSENALNIAKFQLEGGLLIINANLGGSSLNLQNNINEVESVSICNINWSEVAFEQMIRRIHRVDSKSNSTQYILITDDPLDKYMCSTLLKKREKLMVI